MRLVWHVSLSNGENFTEGKGLFSAVKGELSPWLKLQEYIREKQLSITSLQIIDTLPIKPRHFHLPSSGNNPKFRAFSITEKPKQYRFARVLGADIQGGNQELFARAEAVYKDYTLQLWVDENNPDNCWVLVI